jgi:hypothetical protein
MPVHARRLIRKMRGGAQAHLLECDDGRFYVVKFRNNPQHRRILVNEWLASAFLNYLQISTPETAIVDLPADFLASNPGIHIQLGSRHQPIEPGWHFGSRYPGDPAKVIVYDFIPDLLLDKVVNRNEFLGALVFDKWIGNADARQSIFSGRASSSDPRANAKVCRSHDGPRLRFRRAPTGPSRIRPSRAFTFAPASIQKSAPSTISSPGSAKWFTSRGNRRPGLQTDSPGLAGRRRSDSRKIAHQANVPAQTRPGPEPRLPKWPRQPIPQLALASFSEPRP